jgi:hypothetical protein
MKRRALLLCCLVAAVCIAPAHAADSVKGNLVVAGKPIAITHVWAWAQKGFFDPKKQDVVVLMCDADVPAAGIRDSFGRSDLVKANKLHCVQQTINAEKQVINYRVEDGRFRTTDSGGSSEQVFEATTFDGKRVAGRARTSSEQKSFDDVPYSYDLTVDAAVAPLK